MRSFQTSAEVPLAAVKPLDQLMAYRHYCLAETRRALARGARRRQRSPIDGAPLHAAGEVDGLTYARCPASGSLFLESMPEPAEWAQLLERVSRFRHSPDAFHAGLMQSRSDHVYRPKISWMQETLRLQGVEKPRILEAMVPPSDFTACLRESGLGEDVMAVEEMVLAATGSEIHPHQLVQVAVLLESLDRAADPVALLRGVASRLAPGGLVFVTALVASGFDMAVLGTRNLYFYPPDRTNCWSLRGLTRLLEQAGCVLLEVSTPGVLDVEIVRAHWQRDPSLALSSFERELVEADPEAQRAFQNFLQQAGLSSFARIVARKPS